MGKYGVSYMYVSTRCLRVLKITKGVFRLELTPRKKLILAEIVKAYTENGEPIGSKILAARLPNAPSTATLRNEMSELTAMGYLSQPHTSAGRVPTSKAYRLYVSELMKQEALSEEGKRVVDRLLDEISPDPENIGASAAEVLSTLTGLPVVVASNSESAVRLKKVNLLPMGRSSAVVFAITDDGRTKSRLVRPGYPLSEELIRNFNRIATDNIIERDVASLDKAYLQTVTMKAGLGALEIAPLIAAVFDLAAQFKVNDVKLVGTANLFTAFSEELDAGRLLECLNGNEAVGRILSEVTEPVGVVFGDDTEYTELRPTGMIVARFGDQKQFGKIAVIGPTRMSYGKLMPSVKYLAERVGSMMSELLRGLEE